MSKKDERERERLTGRTVKIVNKLQALNRELSALEERSEKLLRKLLMAKDGTD